MAELTFITETGMFHSACRCTWGSKVEWYGFKPRAHRSPHGPGFVDRTDRSGYMNHSIDFEVNDGILRDAVDTVVRRYQSQTYTLLVCDCVSFSADVARQAGLQVPPLNLTPYGFIQVLGFWNHPKPRR